MIPWSMVHAIEDQAPKFKYNFFKVMAVTDIDAMVHAIEGYAAK